MSKLVAQQQTGGADCGVFAIAFAYHAARGTFIADLHFEQKNIRAHLNQCLEEGEFSPFPLALKAAAAK